MLLGVPSTKTLSKHNTPFRLVAAPAVCFFISAGHRHAWLTRWHADSKDGMRGCASTTVGGGCIAVTGQGWVRGERSSTPWRGDGGACGRDTDRLLCVTTDRNKDVVEMSHQAAFHSKHVVVRNHVAGDHTVVNHLGLKAPEVISTGPIYGGLFKSTTLSICPYLGQVLTFDKVFGCPMLYYKCIASHCHPFE